MDFGSKESVIEAAAELNEENISVNSVGPGWVRTKMDGDNVERSIAEGAKGIVWLANEASQTLSNRFFKDKKEINW